MSDIDCCCKSKDCSAQLVLNTENEFFAAFTITGNPAPHSRPTVWLDKEALNKLRGDITAIFERLS